MNQAIFVVRAQPWVRVLGTAALAVALMASSSAWAGKNWIEGQILDRNGEPVDRAIISLEPGNVQMVTDREGRFLIDYLRDAEGERTRLSKRTEYAMEIFKPGFHLEKRAFFYKRGAVSIDKVTLTEETIAIESTDDNLDPSLHQSTTHSSGATYEGQ